MSDLNISLSSTGFIGLEPEKIPPVAVQGNAHSSNLPLSNKLYTEKEQQLTAAQLNELKEITETVNEVNHFLQNMNRDLAFSVDDESGTNIIVVKDSNTEEVIRQIPSEELVVLRKKIDYMSGILFDKKV